MARAVVRRRAGAAGGTWRRYDMVRASSVWFDCAMVRCEDEGLWHVYWVHYECAVPGDDFARGRGCDGVELVAGTPVRVRS